MTLVERLRADAKIWAPRGSNGLSSTAELELAAADTLAALLDALRPFVDEYNKRADPIGDSDLDNEQPRAVFVTLGDCRKAARLLVQGERNG